MYKGAACDYSQFLGKEVLFGRLSWEDFPEKKQKKGGVFKPISRDMGYMFPEPSIASREKDVPQIVG